MTPTFREHPIKLSAPLWLTAFVILWTVAIQRFTRYGDDWALWPVMLALPLAAGLHIYLVVTLRPKRPLIGYAVVHLLALLAMVIICMMLISKDSL